VIVVAATPGDGREQVAPADRSRWRRWLEEDHDSSDGVWVVDTASHIEAVIPVLQEMAPDALIATERARGHIPGI
jgi:hypothetical protein